MGPTCALASLQSPHSNTSYAAKVRGHADYKDSSKSVQQAMDAALDNLLLVAVWCFLHPDIAHEVSDWIRRHLSRHPTGLEVSRAACRFHM